MWTPPSPESDNPEHRDANEPWTRFSIGIALTTIALIIAGFIAFANGC